MCTLYNSRSPMPSHQPNMSNCCVLGYTLSRYNGHSPLCSILVHTSVGKT